MHPVSSVSLQCVDSALVQKIFYHMHYVCNAVFLLPILYSCRTQFDGNDLKIVLHFITFPLTAILIEIEKPSENHFCLAYCFSCKAI